MSDYLQTQILTIILTVYGLCNTGHPYYLLCVMGLLLIVYTIDNLSDQSSRSIIVCKVLLTAIFCVLEPGFFVFLLWGQVCDKRYRPALSPVVFVLWQIACMGRGFQDALPIVIVQTAALTAVSIFLWYAQGLWRRQINDRRQIAASMEKLAQNEFEEHKLNRQLLLQSNIAERNARLEEREKISRNIHNSVGHTITAASMALDAAEVLWDTEPERALEKMRTANERIQSGLASIRHAVRVLDAEVESVSVDDFILELKAIADSFMMGTGLTVVLDQEILAPELYIAHEHTEFLTGAVEELLTNGVRHGHADRFIVRLSADSSHVRITVLDNGTSDFNSRNANSRIQNGFGLKKIIRYVEKAGGSAVFQNENGFCAELLLPVAVL